MRLEKGHKYMSDIFLGGGHILFPLQKHTYSNILKILQPKKENFQIKNSDIFHIPAQNIDCGYSPYLKFPKDSVQLRITPKKILCGVLGHLLRSNFLLKNGKQSGECVNHYDYHHIWNELRTFVTSGVLG